MLQIDLSAVSHSVVEDVAFIVSSVMSASLTEVLEAYDGVSDTGFAGYISDIFQAGADALIPGGSYTIGLSTMHCVTS